VAAGIDVLRSQVQMQAQQQRVLAAQKPVCTTEDDPGADHRSPGDAADRLTDTVPYSPLPELNVEER